MSIDQRQFQQLSEMGIKLWQRREISDKRNSSKLSQTTYQSVDLASLVNNVCFSDILQAFNLTIAEINQQGDHLDLGLVNWYFIDTDNKDEMKITLLNNKLVTPTINYISQSVKFKKQLWQTINQQLT